MVKHRLLLLQDIKVVLGDHPEECCRLHDGGKCVYELATE